MINKIIEILRSEGIEKFLINKTEKSSSELFFIKKKLDVRRSKNITDYNVTVYRDVEKDGEKLRGSAAVGIFPTMTDDEITEKLKEAYFAAQFAANPFYELVKGDGKEITENSAAQEDTEEAVKTMAKALFSVDTDSEAFINSAEFFAENEKIRVVNSDGVDAAFEKFNVNGEFVTQCKTEEDVELHYSFKYDCVDEKALAKTAAEGIRSAKDRSVAKRALKSGNYDIILSGKELATVLSYYTDRSDAAYIYPHYSDYKIGDHIQGDDINGEKLNLTLVATQPYSEEGVKMDDIALVKQGELKAVHGSNRFSQYLGIKPTGFFEKIKLEAGSKTLAEMKEKPYLHAVKFSDFQMDSFTGHFGGEIRLAYLYDGEKITKVTGGSVNGIITKAHKNLVFSTETYSDSSYEGPLAVKIEDVAVAGSN